MAGTEGSNLGPTATCDPSARSRGQILGRYNHLISHNFDFDC